MTFEFLQQNRELILLDCISGSRAYNLATPTSDTDKKGIYILPKRELYGFHQVEQVSDASNDEVYFEIKRFLELLQKNNPNILELLSTPKDCILFKHPLMDLIKPEDFLSKLCLETFAGYATSQIKKAKGLNKKINKAFETERKSVLNFCYVLYKSGSISLLEWLKELGYSQEECGLTSIAHFRYTYYLYHQSQFNAGKNLHGFVSGNISDDILLSSIPKGIEPLAIMNFNKDAYSIYCREYREYWEWAVKRNEARFQSTLSHGKSYDAKNMMHTFRLLNIAEEIAVQQQVNVHRTDRDFLLSIKEGKFEYDKLMEMVDEKMLKINGLYKMSDLPDVPDIVKSEKLLIEIRERIYE